jgi:glycine/D-amino acid oxidase-like deaminating enzyme
VTALARRNGDVSFWQASLPAPPPRPPLPGDRSADVCIVGAGFTGLWAAYHLKLARPRLDVVVLERERVGYGASGRNGGWLTPAFAAPRDRLVREHGAATADALERALRDAVANVLAVCEHERIDCDALAGGVLRVARARAVLDRASGIGFAGGYVGNGVGTADLAGRTLRDLVLGEDIELTRLPWVGHAPRRWEPEPLRWLGATTVFAL